MMLQYQADIHSLNRLTQSISTGCGLCYTISLVQSLEGIVVENTFCVFHFYESFLI